MIDSIKKIIFFFFVLLESRFYRNDMGYQQSVEVSVVYDQELLRNNLINNLNRLLKLDSTIKRSHGNVPAAFVNERKLLATTIAGQLREMGYAL